MEVNGLAHYFVHSSFDSFLSVKIKSMTCYTNYQWLFGFLYLGLFKILPYLSCAFDAIHNRHIEIRENYLIGHLVFISFLYFLKLILAVDACIHDVAQIFNTCQFENNFHGFDAEVFVISDHYSIEFQFISTFQDAKSLRFIIFVFIFSKFLHHVLLLLVNF